MTKTKLCKNNELKTRNAMLLILFLKAIDKGINVYLFVDIQQYFGVAQKKLLLFNFLTTKT